MNLKRWGTQEDIFIQTTACINSPPSPEYKTGLWRAVSRTVPVTCRQQQCCLMDPVPLHPFPAVGLLYRLSHQFIFQLCGDFIFRCLTAFAPPGTAQGHPSPPHVSLTLNLVKRVAATFLSLPPDTCFLGVFKQCILMVSLLHRTPSHILLQSRLCKCLLSSYPRTFHLQRNAPTMQLLN